MKVICNKRQTCTLGEECGASYPHEPCGECEHCPFDKTAKCITLEDEIFEWYKSFCQFCVVEELSEDTHKCTCNDRGSFDALSLRDCCKEVCPPIKNFPFRYLIE